MKYTVTKEERLYSTGNCLQYHIINYTGEGYEK